ncbi:hypothetical protein ABMY12_20805 [Vibrio vulnificus]|uniref:hypothetical protein n=1 Tax=Vibrio vulnificus TaxID=672 RepID=UPI004058BAEA
MNNIIKTAKKWQIPLILLGAWVGFNEISAFYVNQNMEVRNLPILGNANVINKESLLADSSELPILSVKSAQRKTSDTEIDENLFTVASVQNELLKTKNQVIQSSIDYSNDAKEFILGSLTVDAVTHNGVIVNGRFHQRGDAIGIPFTAPDGEVFVAKLVAVKGQQLSFDINGKKVARRYDF